MKEFISDDELPSYAILSHRWGDEEVTFKSKHLVLLALFVFQSVLGPEISQLTSCSEVLGLSRDFGLLMESLIHQTTTDFEC